MEEEYEEIVVRVDTTDDVLVVSVPDDVLVASVTDDVEVVKSPKKILLFSRAANVDVEHGCVLSFSA